jgi:hypothetical protein
MCTTYIIHQHAICGRSTTHCRGRAKIRRPIVFTVVGFIKDRSLFMQSSMVSRTLSIHRGVPAQNWDYRGV